MGQEGYYYPFLAPITLAERLKLLHKKEKLI
nr:MAG TPA: hypothetical protein [Caudoviricetes sp.]